MSRSTLVTAFWLAGVIVIAQQKPDFSSEWKLNRQASTLSPIVAPAAQSDSLWIEHHEPKFAAQMNNRARRQAVRVEVRPAVGRT